MVGRDGLPQVAETGKPQLTHQPQIMPAEIEIPDEIPTLRTISESDWELIENIVELSMQTGDVYGRDATITAERLVQLLEMPGGAVLSLVAHLAYLRRDDLVDALDCANSTVPILDGLLQRNEQARQQHERQAAACQAQKAARNAVWHEAQADPAGTLQRLQELEQTADEGEQLRARCALVGIGGQGLNDASRRRRLRERIATLLIAAPSAPPPPSAPSAREQLIADAREGLAEALQPTTLATLRAWEQRNPYGDPGNDWRRFFHRGSDFVAGRQACELIARAVGSVVDEVAAHAGTVAARDELCRLQVAEAYGSADELLSDAEEAEDWAWLGARLGVPPHLLEARMLELLPDEGEG